MTEQINKCLRYKAGVLGLALILGLSGCWLLSASQPTAKLAPTSAAISTIATSVTTAPVKHYAPKAKAKLALPDEVQRSEAKVVLTATDLPKSKYERTVTTVLDTTTGDAVQYVQTKPLPLFASASTGSLAAYAGLKNLEPAMRIQATQDLFAVKALTFGATASVDVTRTGGTDTFIGIGARYEW